MNKYLYFALALLVMAGVTYLIRLLPLLFIKKRITNRFIRSFLYYVPYVVLSAMSFPTIFFSTGSLISAIIAVAVCVALAYCKRGLITVAIGGAVSVLVTELILTYL